MESKKSLTVLLAANHLSPVRPVSNDAVRRPNVKHKHTASLFKTFESEHQQINHTKASYSNSSELNSPLYTTKKLKQNQNRVNPYYEKVVSPTKKLYKKFSCNANNPENASHIKPRFLQKKSHSINENAMKRRSSYQTLRFGSKEILVIKRLGEGKYGNVSLVMELKTGMLMAMKSLEKDKIASQKLLDQLISELKIQTFLDDPNIVKTYGFFHDAKNFYILMELGSDGQLYSKIQKSCMSQQSASFIIRSLLKAVNQLHTNKIIHRDIKPENIVITHGTVKLCDFGWAVHEKKQLRSTYCGTPLYFSPQLIVGQRYDEKVDIWAIGVLTYELVLGDSPFGITKENHLYKIVTDQVRFPQNIKKKLSHSFKSFVTCVLQRNPKDRLSCEELLRMPFIRQYEDLETCQQLCR